MYLFTLLPATALTDEITAFGAVAMPMTLAIMWVISSMMDRKLAKLLKDINGAYVKKEVADLKYVQIEHHFDYLRDVKNREDTARHASQEG
jgi:hypothetical protein